MTQATRRARGRRGVGGRSGGTALRRAARRAAPTRTGHGPKACGEDSSKQYSRWARRGEWWCIDRGSGRPGRGCGEGSDGTVFGCVRVWELNAPGGGRNYASRWAGARGRTTAPRALPRIGPPGAANPIGRHAPPNWRRRSGRRGRGAAWSRESRCGVRARPRAHARTRTPGRGARAGGPAGPPRHVRSPAALKRPPHRPPQRGRRWGAAAGRPSGLSDRRRPRCTRSARARARAHEPQDPLQPGAPRPLGQRPPARQRSARRVRRPAARRCYGAPPAPPQQASSQAASPYTPPRTRSRGSHFKRHPIPQSPSAPAARGRVLPALPGREGARRGTPRLPAARGPGAACCASRSGRPARCAAPRRVPRAPPRRQPGRDGDRARRARRHTGAVQRREGARGGRGGGRRRTGARVGGAARTRARGNMCAQPARAAPPPTSPPPAAPAAAVQAARRPRDDARL
jgi:hypothetical protein